MSNYESFDDLDDDFEYRFGDADNDEEEENNMSAIDFTKPVYTSLSFDYSGLTNDLDAVTRKASQSAKNDRDGDDYLILKAVKRVSIPVSDATVIDLVA